MGEHPAHPNIGGVADWKYSTQVHTREVSQIGKKILKKNLDSMKYIFYLWRVGGFVYNRNSSFLHLYRLKIFHNIAMD
jgi:hypothetical protein